MTAPTLHALALRRAAAVAALDQAAAARDAIDRLVAFLHPHMPDYLTIDDAVALMTADERARFVDLVGEVSDIRTEPPNKEQ